MHEQRNLHELVAFLREHFKRTFLNSDYTRDKFYQTFYSNGILKGQMNIFKEKFQLRETNKT